MNISDVLTQLGVPWIAGGTHHHVRPGWVGLDCPRCSPGTRRWRLGVTLDGRRTSCWQCGAQNLYEVLREVTEAPPKRLYDLLRGVQPARVEESKPSGVLRVPRGVGRLLKPHRRYLEDRGFDADEIAEVWGVGGIGPQPKLAWTIYIPVGLHGEVQSWTTRQLHDRGVRYVSASPDEERLPLKSLLYGEDKAGHAVVVCEGPFDVWRVGPGAVCTFGTQVTRAQMARIARHPVRTICFDNEPAAQARARSLCRSLQAFPGDTFRVVLGGKDPASSSRKEVRELRRRFL